MCELVQIKVQFHVVTGLWTAIIEHFKIYEQFQQYF